MIKIIKCANGTEVGEVAADYVAKLLLTKNNAILGLPTGSTPIPMYQKIVSWSNQSKFNWDKVTTFNLDEYYNLSPLYIDQSYVHFMDENLFSHININKSNIHFPYYQGMNELDINHYDTLIDSMGGLDLTILGVGTDGHIAFNEPGSELNSITRLVKLSYQTRKDNSRFFNDDIKNVPEFAVTMGLETILKSHRILLLVSGKSKEQALQHLLEAKEFDPNWPVTSLINAKELILITDLNTNQNK